MTFGPALRGEKQGWDSAATADWKEPARSVSRNAAPTAAYYLARRLGVGEVRGGEASCELDELLPWRLRSSAVAASAMANGGRWSCGCG